MNTILKTAIGLLLGAVLIGLFRYGMAVWFMNAAKDVIFKRTDNSVSNKNEDTLKNVLPNKLVFPETIKEITSKYIESIEKQRYLRENQDLLDMPPREHENKWNKVFNKKQTCWYHKKSMKKICEPS
ncbi:MAG: hypothetical protein Q7U57_07370 [Methylovulum sp.]|nr:hypothetical protein [Methylovulum sp.]